MEWSKKAALTSNFLKSKLSEYKALKAELENLSGNYKYKLNRPHTVGATFEFDTTRTFPPPRR